MIVSVFCVAAVGTASRTSRPFRPSSIGVTICSRNRSASLFAGWVSSAAGARIEAVEKVCSGDGIEEFEVLDLLEQLVDKSLITVERDASGNSRYTMIESVWHYSREKLEASGEAPAVRDRHLNYFLAFAEEAEPHLRGSGSKGMARPLPERTLQYSLRHGMGHQIAESRDGTAPVQRAVPRHRNSQQSWRRLGRSPCGFWRCRMQDVAPKYKADARLSHWPARMGG